MRSVSQLEIYLSGELSVIGFDTRNPLDHVDVSEYYDEIMELVRKNGCKALAIDFTGVQWIPSGLLGVLMSVRRLNIEVHLYNPPTDILEVLEITKLTKSLNIHKIDFDT